MFILYHIDSSGLAHDGKLPMVTHEQSCCISEPVCWYHHVHVKVLGCSEGIFPCVAMQPLFNVFSLI
jgi:hypothetical protein